MAYDLFFRQAATCSADRWQGPALGFTMPRDEWEATSITTPEMTPEIEHYLGGKLRWKTDEAGRLGFGGAAILDKRIGYVEVVFPYQRRNVKNAMLTLSFLLQDFARPQSREERERDHLQLYVGCGSSQTIFGCASEKFQEALLLLDDDDLTRVAGDMRSAWAATATRQLKRCVTYCRARVREDGRFELDCFGDACDLSMYPDSAPEFSCHNLDIPFQQATLLAGLASLLHQAKRKVQM